MTHRSSSIRLALAVALATAPVIFVASGASASARPSSSAHVTPPWEPDTSSVGGLTFYNASGDVITGGSTSDAPLAAYVEGTHTVRAGDTRATLFGYLPINGQSPGEWSGEALSLSTTYPNGSAPGTLGAASLPLNTGADSDESIATLELDFPNNDTTSDGYAGLYQLRLRTSGLDEGLTTTYDSADIEVTGSTWSVVYTAGSPTSTTTTLTASPSGTMTYGTAETLTATVHPSSSGVIDFRSNGKLLKAVTLSSGRATLRTTLAGGSDKVAATYVPASNANDTGSTSSTLTVTVKAHTTTTTLSAPASSTKGKKVSLKAKVSPTGATGTVIFYVGARKIGSAAVKGGVATITTTSLSVGRESLKASFKPTTAADYGTSTSKVVIVTVHA